MTSRWFEIDDAEIKNAAIVMTFTFSVLLYYKIWLFDVIRNLIFSLESIFDHFTMIF